MHPLMCRLARMLVAVVMGLSLAACGRLGIADEEAVRLGNPSQRHPIAIQSAEAEMLLDLPPAGVELGAGRRAAVEQFVSGFLAESTGRLRLSIPAGMRVDSEQLALREVMLIVEEAGIAQDEVRLVRHRGRDVPSTLRLSYPRRQAVPPDCGDWSEDLGVNTERLPHPDFGCATQRNLALNVANPRDLTRPAREQPRSSERRSTDWSKYIGAPAGGAQPAPSSTKQKPPPKSAPPLGE